MKKTQLITITTLVTLAVAATALCLVRKTQRKKRLVTVSDAGYETAYDVHFPLKYKR